MMAVAFPSQENRQIKKPRLGPPDVYPQDPKQKEDELNQSSVKMGFTNTALFNDEYGTAGSEKGLWLNIDAFTKDFEEVMLKKIEINTLLDIKKNKQVPSKENFWPACVSWQAARSKQGVEAWFKDLAGSKPLAQLSRKVPTFNKKDEIFSTLCEYAVPLIRAAWFIKTTAAHNMATQDSRMRRRQTADQSVDWTQSLTKYLREQLQRIQDYYQGGSGSSQTQFLLAKHTSPVDMEQALKQWNYGARLAKHMYNEGLLDQNEMLLWLVEVLEKMQNPDDTVLKLLLLQIDCYIDEIILSFLLSRRLAYFCCKYLQEMCEVSDGVSPTPIIAGGINGSCSAGSGGNESGNSLHFAPSPHLLLSLFMEYRDCPQHRSIMLKLCAVVQNITLRCPTALVWNWLGDGKTSIFICESPLDILPCSPSVLPMLPAPNNHQIRSQLRACEDLICSRSLATEVNWSSDKCQKTHMGFITSKVVTVLDMLDRHHFDHVDSSNNLDVLYSGTFSLVTSKNGCEPTLSDEPIVRLLIDWAVSTQRSGEHRAIITAKLLAQRQAELHPDDLPASLDKDDVASEDMASVGAPIYQSILMDFLDYHAPLMDEDQKAFRNLILLFHELIIHDVFSHDLYMCTLIARGDLLCAFNAPCSAEGTAPCGMKSPNEMTRGEPHEFNELEFNVHMGIHTMELDFSSILGGTEDDRRCSPEPPTSVSCCKSEIDTAMSCAADTRSTHPISHTLPPSHGRVPQFPKGPSRHLVYATHMPIPQEDYTTHECNQRLIVLYGVGKGRDEARRCLKKTTKEIVRLFSKRNCIDVNSGDIGKVKKRKDKDGKDVITTGVNEPTSISVMSSPAGMACISGLSAVTTANCEALMNKFQALSYHDQHSVTAQCVTALLNQMRTFVEGNSSLLPQLQPIAFLLELMQHALNLNGLMSFVVDLLKVLCEVERQLVSNESALIVRYTTPLCLRVVGVLRKYYCYFIASHDVVQLVFKKLMEVLKVVNVCNPVSCSTEERNMLSLLYDLFTVCNYLKAEFEVLFIPAYTKMSSTLYAPVEPSAPNYALDPEYMLESIRGGFSPIHNITEEIVKSPSRGYCFVCNAMLEVTQTTNIDTLNTISVFCAQLTAKCENLTSDWLGLLRSLCCSSNRNCGFVDILTQIDVSDLSLHDNIAVFTAILVARRCFSLKDFIVHIAAPSLMAACPSAGGEQDAEPGARLACHLLLRLFKPSLLTSQQSTRPYTTRMVPMVQDACDRQMLAASHCDVGIGPLAAILKAMLILGDETSDVSKKCTLGRSTERNISSLLENLADGGVDMDAVLGSSKSGMESRGLNDFAKHSLQQICQQDWVRDVFLKDIDQLFRSEVLIDNMLSNKQAQQLLHYICYPGSVPSSLDVGEGDDMLLIGRVLQNLDQWSLRVSYLELKLLLEQAGTQAETNSILDHIARATIDLFYRQTETKPSNGIHSLQQTKSSPAQQTVWLVGPLLSCLPSAIQGKVLKLAGQVLESGNNLFVSAKSKQEKDRNQKSQSLLGHQPFLALVRTCLEGQDEQRECLLASLMMQLDKFIINTKDILERTPDESKIRVDLHEALRLRLSLVGAMFDTIQRSNAATSDWAVLLLQLISHDVVDCQTNIELFYTVIDMLSVLVLSTLITDGQEKVEDNRKVYHNLIKKLKKELGDKHSAATDKLRQLLPVPKRFYEVVCVDPFGTYVDSRGNKNVPQHYAFKKLGQQVGQKIKMSPWEVMEGYKNPAPISWSYFGAVRLEKKTATYEEEYRQLLYHTHSLCLPASHYLQLPPLPPEELQPQQEKTDEKPKESVESQPPDTKKNKKGTRRARKPAASPSFTQQPVRPYPSYHQDHGMYLAPSGTHPAAPWSYGAQQPRYYTPVQMSQRQAHFAVPPGGGHSKSAINGLIQHRLSSHMPQGAPGQAMYMVPKQHNHQSLLRQHILSKKNIMEPGVYPNHPSMPPSNVQQMMGQPSQGYYRSMPTQPSGMVESMNTGVPPAGFNQQSFNHSQGSGMIPAVPAQQGGHMPQPGMVQSQQYSDSARMAQQMVGTPGMQASPSGMSSLSAYSQVNQGGSGQHLSSSQVHQLRQQQLMAMHQQQQTGQQAPPIQQQQPTAQYVSQLQRRITSGMQAPAQPGPASHFNSYGQY